MRKSTNLEVGSPDTEGRIEHKESPGRLLIQGLYARPHPALLRQLLLKHLQSNTHVFICACHADAHMVIKTVRFSARL